MSAFSESLERIQAEGAGVFDILVLQPSDAPDILADALAGDPQAPMLLRTMGSTIASIEEAPRRARKLCACCPRPLRRGRYSIGLVLPRRDSPTEALAMGVCVCCGTEREAIRAKLGVALRRIWPDLRQVKITHHAGGRA